MTRATDTAQRIGLCLRGIYRRWLRPRPSRAVWEHKVRMHAAGLLTQAELDDPWIDIPTASRLAARRQRKAEQP